MVLHFIYFHNERTPKSTFHPKMLPLQHIWRGEISHFWLFRVGS